MAKQTQIEKALANLRSERDILELAIRKLEAQIQAKPATEPRKALHVAREQT